MPSGITSPVWSPYVHPCHVSVHCTLLTVCCCCINVVLCPLTGCSDQGEQVWVWQYESDEDCHQLYMEVDEEIRFKVVDEAFVDVVPTSEPPASTPHTPTTPLLTPTVQLHTPSTEAEDTQEQPLPYRITVFTTCGHIYMPTIL